MDTELKRRMSPPLSLVTIATLIPKKHKVFIEDENIPVINFDDNPDIVGITVNIDTAYRAYEIAERYRKNGIMVNASIVLGSDQDTEATFKGTLDWLIKNKVETMTAHILTPYPGTKLYKELESGGRIIENNLRKYNTSNVVFMPANMSPDELRNGYLIMYKEFYALKNIIKRIPENKKILISFLLFNFLYRKFGWITSYIGKLGKMNFVGNLARKLSYGIG